ncbi:MAG: hypothetical protein SFZ02_14455 [bacterium]|nr:hypothetical protein [bacterium]
MGIITGIYSINADNLQKNDMQAVLDAINFADTSKLAHPITYDKLYLDKAWYDFELFFRGIAPYIPRDVYKAGRQTNVNYKGMDVGYWASAERVWVLQATQAFCDGEDKPSPRPITIRTTDLETLFDGMEKAMNERLKKDNNWKMEDGEPFTRDMAVYILAYLKATIHFLLLAHEAGNKSIIQISA